MIVRHRTSKAGRTQHPDTQGPGGRDQVRNVAAAASQEAFVFETCYRTADADVMGSRWTNDSIDPSKVPFRLAPPAKVPPCRSSMLRGVVVSGLTTRIVPLPSDPELNQMEKDLKLPTGLSSN
jgi:hypothetical protein